MITVVGNLKGGSGKSTVSFNLAVWLRRQGQEVTVFDLDPQRTLSDVAEVRAEEGHMPQFPVLHAGDDLAARLAGCRGEVLVDVGSADMAAMRTALGRADRVVIPVPPSQADIWSTQRFLQLIDGAVIDRRPKVLAFINRADTHIAIRESDEAEEALESLPGVEVLGLRLYQRTAYRRSFSEGLGVFELEPSGKAAAEFEEFAGVLYSR